MKLYVKEWFFLDGQELQGLGEPIIDKGRHPYIVILDSNNEHIGEYVIAVQGTTYRQTNVQNELLKDGDGVIVKLKNQSFIFTNHVHDDITGSMVAKIEGTISGMTF